LHGFMEEIELERERNRAYPLWVWDVYALSHRRGCGAEDAFRLLWEPRRGEAADAAYIIEAARALLRWRELAPAKGLLGLLYRIGDAEAFLWLVLILAE